MSIKNNQNTRLFDEQGNNENNIQFLSQAQKYNQRKGQIFIAMWLSAEGDDKDRMDKFYNEAVQPAIKVAGFEPYRIDQDNTVEKLDDGIISAIDESDLVLVDLTHDRKGVRGSVYFEAGYAYQKKQ